MHVMPDERRKPFNWNPLGKLVLKSESDTDMPVEVSGQEEAREFSTQAINLPAHKRVIFENPFYSVTSIHIKNIPIARLGIHSAVYKVAHIISPPDRGKHSGVWMDHTLAGYISRAEFRQRARLVAPNSRVFQYDRTKTKNLAVPISSLNPLQELLTRVREWSRQNTGENN